MGLVDEFDDLAYFVGQNVVKSTSRPQEFQDWISPTSWFLISTPKRRPFPTWSHCPRAAGHLFLVGIDCFLKTTGKRGVHVHVPIESGLTFDELRPWIRKLPTRQLLPYRLSQTTEQRISHREGQGLHRHVPQQLFANRHRTYAPRAHPEATIALPVPWSALDNLVGADTANVNNLRAHVSGRTDPWQRFFESSAPIDKLMSLINA